jgi:ankyrin repeat protein
LFVPYSFVQGEGRQRTEVTEGGGVLTVVPVLVNINLKTETVDELKQKKKRLHLASAGAVVEEVRYELEQWAASAEAAARLQRDTSCNYGGTFTAATIAAKIIEQCDAVLKRHRETGMEDYVDDGVFRGLVSEMLDTRAWAIEKKQLWMQDATQYVCLLQNESLRNCHRQWEMFLRQSVTGAADSSADGASAGLRLLKCRGLVKQGVLEEKNSDGEPVMVQAGADGWSATDIFAAAAAGADVCATTAEGQSGVYFAAQFGHLDSLTALLKAGGDANQSSVHGRLFHGESPIFRAASYGHASIIEQLVSCKGDVTKCRNDGSSPIGTAAFQGHASLIPLLVSCKGDVNKCTDNGFSPLHGAAFKGHAACISQLLAHRADPRLIDEEGFFKTSALEKARAGGHAECVRLLEAALQ